MKQILILFILFTFANAEWGTSPGGWGDFQVGLNARPGASSANEMAKALNAGAKLDRRYVYATTPQEVFPDGSAAFLFTDDRNYAYESGFYDKGVKPTMTIYMLQRGEDGLGAVKSGAADKNFMKEYFEAILVMVDSCKGTQPIYVIEPDVWGYMLQGYESDMGESNLNSLCHINDLGFPWLEEFDNTLRDLPKAVIKTIKIHDPTAYAGMLMAYWSYRPSSATGTIMVQFDEENVKLSGQKAGEFAKKLIGDTPWSGDFMGVEKNGAGAGWYQTQGRNEYMWNDEENGKWLLWSKEMAKTCDLPLFGWQISAGYDNESGYPELPNTNNQFKDTFFSYFFSHVLEFIDAGFIGLMLGAEDRGIGTICTIDDNTFDHGFFYDKMEVFNTNRPYLDDSTVYHTIVAKVIPDTVEISSGSKYPAWESGKVYETPTHGDTISHNGFDYVQVGWYINGIEPGTDDSQWGLVGPSGEFEVTVGGTVDNHVVYFESGTTALKEFNPVSIDGYGIGSITVNGEKIPNVGTYTIPSIDKDYVIEVHFIPGGDTLETAVEQVKTTKQAIAPITLRGKSLTAHVQGTVSLFSLNGQQVLRKEVRAGTSIPLTGMSKGIYILRSESTQGILVQKLNLGL